MADNRKAKNDGRDRDRDADVFKLNLAAGKAEQRDLGESADEVEVKPDKGTTQIRLTFTSAEVGNDSAIDGGTLAN